MGELASNLDESSQGATAPLEVPRRTGFLAISGISYGPDMSIAAQLARLEGERAAIERSSLRSDRDYARLEEQLGPVVKQIVQLRIFEEDLSAGRIVD